MADGSTVIQALLDLLPPMGQFCCPHHLPGRIIDQSQPCRLGAWIDLDPQRLKVGYFDSCFEYNSKGVELQHCCFPLSEQDPCSSRVYRVQWPFVGIDDKDM